MGKEKRKSYSKVVVRNQAVVLTNFGGRAVPTLHWLPTLLHTLLAYRFSDHDIYPGP